MANITGRQLIFITLGAAAVPTIKIATDAAYTQNVEYIQKSALANVKAVYNASPGSQYPYPTQTMATVSFIDGMKTWTFELQDVDAGTHASWNTGNMAACTAFANDCAAAGF